MQKKISIDQVRLGMFIDRLDGSWIDSPFWKKAFKLTDSGDLKSIQSSGIKNVWIDTDKGLDIAGAATEKTIRTAVAKKPSVTEKHLTFDQEIEQARRIQAEAGQKITSMFQEARMGKALQAENAGPITDEIYQSVVRNPGALISLTRLKSADDYTYMHSVAVCALMIALGRQMGLDEAVIKPLGMAGLLHDVGKMTIPDEVLNKPGSLDDAEFDLVKSHPLRGWEMLKESTDVDDIALDVCLHHHEKVSGTGYPEKLSGDEISLYAKMGAVCDVYDAITSDRSYKKGWAPADSIRKMASWKSGHFDEVVFDNFVQMIGIYPLGTLLKLNSGRLGVVVDQSKTLLKPKVKVIYSSTAGARIPPKIIDLDKSGETIECIEDPTKYGIDTNMVLGLTDG